MDETQTLLGRLAGSWSGSGVGDYPTIERFEYEETLRFELDARYPLIHYEQRTRLASGEASHWESGFLRWQEDGSIELSNAQDSGRVEVLRGRLVELEDGFDLSLMSVAIAWDPRMVGTRRDFRVRADRLDYVVQMSTSTTDSPRMGQHLEAHLERVSAAIAPRL
jgi:hypothetical protein